MLDALAAAEPDLLSAKVCAVGTFGTAGLAKEALGLTEPWEVSKETYEYFATHKKDLISKYDEWKTTFAAWEKANPEKAKQLQAEVKRLQSVVKKLEEEKGAAAA